MQGFFYWSVYKAETVSKTDICMWLITDDYNDDNDYFVNITLRVKLKCCQSFGNVESES